MESIRSITANRQLGEIRALEPWFHNIHLDNGIQTSPGNRYGDFPNFKWKQIRDEIPADLSGWTALDIGCNAGFYTFELARRGATVLGIDLDPHYLTQARWVAEQLNMSDRVRFEQMQVYDLKNIEQQFDMVIFMGVFYHLRYPMFALDIVSQKVRKMLVFQTMTSPGDEVFEPATNIEMDERELMLNRGWPSMSFIEKKLAGDPTNWWAPNHSGILAMLRTCGLKVVAHPGHEIYVAVPDPAFEAVARGWNRSEYLSAAGEPWSEAISGKVGHDEANGK